jgi:hypothetical protein
MERVVFLIEGSNERLGCLLNPETLLVRRTAGLQPRQSIGGWLSGAGMSDDPLLHTGGGRTELQLDLLFDVSLAGSSLTGEDVRELTAPLWRLAENSDRQSGRPRSQQTPQVRFLWGKAWDVPGVITAVAERLEQFNAAGAPQRSWMRLRLLRVNDPTVLEAGEQPGDTAVPPLPADWPEEWGLPGEDWDVHQMVGGPSPAATGDQSEETDEPAPAPSNIEGERLDQLAYLYFGDPALWRLLATINDVADPLHIASGTLLRIPPALRRD